MLGDGYEVEVILGRKYLFDVKEIFMAETTQICMIRHVSLLSRRLKNIIVICDPMYFIAAVKMWTNALFRNKEETTSFAIIW